MATLEATAKSVNQVIRQYIRDTNQSRTIAIGRSRHSASAGSQTPIVIIAGDQEPTLDGLPYLKTTFRNGSFSKTLYTPSTLKIVVGAEWIEKNTGE